MGGYGSGRHGRHNKTDQFQQLDMRKLHREGRLQKGMEASVPIGGGAPIALQFDWTPCRFGGARPWWWCPHCARRRAVLYVCGNRIGCRRCLDLVYRSTCQDAAGRAVAKYRKILRRLGGEGNFEDNIPEKPPGMRWRTYDRLCQQAEAALVAHGQALDQRFAPWLRRMMLTPK